jgi:hypothetical protein
VKITVLDEPELEFRAGNRHIDPRHGIDLFGPADADAPTAPKRIAAGLVGPAEAVEGVRRWLERCRDPIERKQAKRGQENMFPPFPGFSKEQGFGSELVFDDRLVRLVADRDLRRLAAAGTRGVVNEAVTIYFESIQSLAETNRCAVILVARPDQLHDGDEPPAPAEGEEEETETAEETGRDFHDVLKARALILGCPLQLIRRETWDPNAKRPAGDQRSLQDEATRAWNLHTALYYKAGGTPWRMPRVSTELASCFVGVGFFRTTDETQLHTAVAQVFNERGDGIVVRGGAAKVSKTDRQPHLNEHDSRQLLIEALSEYRTVHGHLPARVVLHKTSSFDTRELAGFTAAADEERVEFLEPIWVQRRDAPRLFRAGQLPPLRGTMLHLDEGASVLYTRGSIEFFHTYPGLYVPRPLLVRPALASIDLIVASGEVLALSKMNWNNAQLDERDPLTLRTAGRVGAILKHVPLGQTVATRYAYYM